MTAQIWATEVVANTTTAGAQSKPTVAVLNDGGYIIVWQDNSDGANNLRAQRFSADGGRLGAELDISIDGLQPDSNPAVAALADGGFAVAWQDGNTLTTRRFDGVGQALQYDQALQPGSGISQPSLSGLGAGQGRVAVSVHNGDILQTRWDSSGAFISSTTVNTTTAGLQDAPDVTQLVGGRYVVTWSTDGVGVRARVFEATGSAVGADFAVNTTTPNGTDYAPKVTALANGGFVVVWNPAGNPSPGSAYDVRGRVFDGGGTALGADFLVNTPTAGQQFYPDVVGLADGGFVAVWADSFANAIRGQQYDLFGGRVGSSFLISTEAGESVNEDGLSAALLKDGRIVVTWEATTIETGEDIRSAIVDPRGGYIEGGAGNETLYGGGSADAIFALGGQDSVLAGRGADTVYAGAGHDNVYGGAQDDVLYGQGEGDALVGDKGDDELFGGAGDDRLYGVAGADTLNGGSGYDIASYSTSTSGVVVDILNPGANKGDAAGDVFLDVERFELSAFADQFVGGVGDDDAFGYEDADVLKGGVAGADTLDGGGGDDKLYGETGDDVLAGNLGKDSLFGGDGGDLLEGWTENDQLQGDVGADTLVGGLGADQLFGGSDADRFVLESLADSAVDATGRDRIRDFAHGQSDLIDLSGIDAKLGGGGDVMNEAFVLVAAFTGTAGELTASFSGAGGGYAIVQGDVDGDGVADFALRVDCPAPLVAADFVL